MAANDIHSTHGETDLQDFAVKQGDCICSIAFENGFFWETLWNHSRNAELKDKRKDPNVLKPGDVVHIPEKREKLESGDTEKRHCFRLKGIPAKLQLRLLKNGKPRTDLKYRLLIDATELRQGTTDRDGWIKVSILPDAREALLTLLTGGPPEEYRLRLSHLDPLDTLEGVQARLANLCFYAGPVTGDQDDATTDAIRAFQCAQNLEVNGRIDESMLAKLKQLHRS